MEDFYISENLHGLCSISEHFDDQKLFLLDNFTSEQKNICISTYWVRGTLIVVDKWDLLAMMYDFHERLFKRVRRPGS